MKGDDKDGIGFLYQYIMLLFVLIDQTFECHQWIHGL